MADLNADGRPDLTLANRNGQPNFVYLNTGDATFDDRRPFGTGSDETRSVAIGDLNGDGHLDIVTANIGEANGVYFGDGTGNFDDAGVRFGRTDGQTYAVVLADLDGDGDQDIVVGNVQAENAALFTAVTERALRKCGLAHRSRLPMVWPWRT